MTIQHPRGLPASRIQTFAFELERRDVTTPEQGGRLISVQRGPPAWRAALSTQARDEAEFGLWRAWLASLKGSGRAFLLGDVWRRYPRRYARTRFTDLERAGGGAFDGTSPVWSVNAARDELTIAALPVSLRLSEGDYAGIVTASGQRSLHRILEDAAAGGDGAGVWTVEPAVPAFVTDGTVHLAAPTCLMRLIPGTVRADRDGARRAISFEALQIVRT